MWPTTFTSRLDAWTTLRAQSRVLPPELALEKINAWWSQTPWRAYHLHWDDQDSWPDPWELLSDNLYCDVAKGLGILYTISLLDHKDLTDAALVLTSEGYNLVLVSKRKYILNWDHDSIVNTNQKIEVTRCLTQHQVQNKYN
jgi:hypothetical protein